jgi:hypothetical protein
MTNNIVTSAIVIGTEWDTSVALTMMETLDGTFALPAIEILKRPSMTVIEGASSNLAVSVIRLS